MQQSRIGNFYQWSRLKAALALVVGLLLCAPAAFASNASLMGVPKYAAVLMDPATGEILYARNPDDQRHPASITKVMTLFLTFEALESGDIKLTDRVHFSRHARNQAPSKLGVGKNQTISVSQAIQALATKSANDVAAALAEHLAGSERAFTQKMNARARELGMTHSNFVNASGLPNSRHYSTARDIAILSQAMLKQYPQFYSYFQQQQFTWGGRVMPNHNKLLGRSPGVDGIKTGYTVASGFTLAASAVRDGKRLIAVVLGAPTSASRDRNVEALLDAGYGLLAERRQGRVISVAARVDAGEDLPPAMAQAQPTFEMWRVLAEQGSEDSVTGAGTQEERTGIVRTTSQNGGKLSSGISGARTVRVP